jgi:hypothetical protein
MDYFRTHLAAPASAPPHRTGSARIAPVPGELPREIA